MDAMIFEGKGKPLKFIQQKDPVPGSGQLLLEVSACGVCRTDLHIVDHELTDPKLPLILGHEIVGQVLQLGASTEGFAVGDKVGVPWVGQTCGKCKFCLLARENLCKQGKFTGYDFDGGYATRTVANASFCFKLPGGLSDEELAPLL